MIPRFIKYLRANEATTPKIIPENYRPTDFSINLKDLGMMFTLRRWHQTSSPSMQQKLTYLRDIEELHNEINFVNTRKMMIRYFWWFVIVFTLYSFFLEREDTRYSYAKFHDQKFTLKMYNELDEGGLEGG